MMYKMTNLVSILLIDDYYNKIIFHRKEYFLKSRTLFLVNYINYYLIRNL